MSRAYLSFARPLGVERPGWSSTPRHRRGSVRPLPAPSPRAVKPVGCEPFFHPGLEGHRFIGFCEGAYSYPWASRRSGDHVTTDASPRPLAPEIRTVDLADADQRQLLLPVAL